MTEDNRLVSQQQLDRLAAGDTSVEEAREIVESLDRNPDGWKQCALALLEAQSWRRAMRNLTAENDPEVVTLPPRESAQRIVPESHPLWRVAGLATIVAAALIVGISLGRRSLDPTPNVEQPTAESKRTQADIAVAELRTDAPERKRRVGLLKVEGESGTLRFVPVVYDSQADRATSDHEPPRLSEYERHLLALNGWEVKQDRELLTVRLADGGQLTIPIDALRYRSIRRHIN